MSVREQFQSIREKHDRHAHIQRQHPGARAGRSHGGGRRATGSRSPTRSRATTPGSIAPSARTSARAHLPARRSRFRTGTDHTRNAGRESQRMSLTPAGLNLAPTGATSPGAARREMHAGGRHVGVRELGEAGRRDLPVLDEAPRQLTARTASMTDGRRVRHPQSSGGSFAPSWVLARPSEGGMAGAVEPENTRRAPTPWRRPCRTKPCGSWTASPRSSSSAAGPSRRTHTPVRAPRQRHSRHIQHAGQRQQQPPDPRSGARHAAIVASIVQARQQFPGRLGRCSLAPGTARRTPCPASRRATSLTANHVSTRREFTPWSHLPLSRSAGPRSR